MKTFNEAAWWRENFPGAEARKVADAAVDALDVNEPMTKFIDVWLAAYKAAGGKRGDGRP